MKKKISYCFIILAIIMLISACSPDVTVTATQTPEPTAAAATDAPAPTPTAEPAPTPTPVPLPAITLTEGNNYFSVDGSQSFVFSRNVAGYQGSHYQTFIGWAKSGGSRFVRIQLDSWEMGYTSTGGVDGAWAARWDKVFDMAQANGIYVLPVFSGWFDWNAGKGYSTWDKNPLNEANGGPVKNPAELFEKDSAAQTMWLQWMKTLVERWKGRSNILGWEIFSEVNLSSCKNESSGIDFVNTAAALIRAADPGRPVTASIADTGTWPNFYRDTDIDFINIHPYPPSAELDRTVVQEVRNYFGEYGKPVLIGESGLNAESPEKYPENAEIGVRHAIWAGIVSGSMNGRALYWEDSFALFFPKQGMAWMDKYKTLELSAAEFVKGVDFKGFAPLNAKTSKGIWGAAVGNENNIIGWFRDAGCDPPEYELKTMLSKQSVTITVPGNAENWQVDFYSTKDGVTLLGSVGVDRKGKTITIPLPDFSDDIAFKAYDKVINVYSFNNDLSDIIERYLKSHPDFDFTIKHNIIPSDGGQYQSDLDKALAVGAADIYCVDSASVAKYTQGDMSCYAISYEDLGIDVGNETEAADTPKYIIDVGTRPSDNAVVGLAWQSNAGVFIYRRSIAKKVWNTDDPAVIKTKVGPGWDKFFSAAADLKEKGYCIVSGCGDIWHSIENSADKGWIVDGKLYIDPKREAFLDYSKQLVSNGYTNNTQEWTPEWTNDMAGKGGRQVFGFFGPSWLINYVMTMSCGGTTPGKGTYGDWAVCEPPVGFFWGGTWVLANKELANDTAKKAAVASLIGWITLDCTKGGIQYALANGKLQSSSYTKNSAASGTVMAISNGKLKFLGGQNMFDAFIPAGRMVNGTNITQYDEIIGGIWRGQVSQYASGSKTREQAIADFKQEVKEQLGIDAWS